MNQRPLATVSSAAGSVAGLCAPIFMEALTDELGWRASHMFVVARVLGVPLACAVAGAVLGARAGRRVPAGASLGERAWAVARVAVLGAGWSVLAAAGLGAAGMAVAAMAA